MKLSLHWQECLTVFLLMAILFGPVVQPLSAAGLQPMDGNTSARWSTVLKAVAGFVGGGVLAAAMGAGGLVVAVAAVGGAVIAPQLFKKIREVTRQVFGNDHRVTFVSEPTDQDEKAALFIQQLKERAKALENAEKLPPDPTKSITDKSSQEPAPASFANWSNESLATIVRDYEDSYKAYIAAIGEGDLEKAKVHLAAFETYQAAKKELSSR